jgi:hypothetical protein
VVGKLTAEEEKIPVRLTVKLGGIEVNVEASIDRLLAELDKILELVKQLSSRLPAKVEEEIQPTVRGETEYPAIKPSRSSMENLQSLFSTSWGQTPRSLSDVTKALEINGVPDSPSNVTVYLKRLVARGFLRRILREGKYYYYKIPESTG